MSDDYRRLMLQVLIEIAQDLLFRLGIHCTQTVVKYNDFRVLDQASGNRHPLLLASAERNAPLPDHGIVTVAKPFNFLVDAGIMGRYPDLLLVRLLEAELDITRDGITKEENIL